MELSFTPIYLPVFSSPQAGPDISPYTGTSQGGGGWKALHFLSEAPPPSLHRRLLQRQSGKARLSESAWNFQSNMGPPAGSGDFVAGADIANLTAGREGKSVLDTSP